MANIVEVTLRGIDEASKMFSNASQQAEQAMSSASQSVGGLSSTIEGVPNVDVSTSEAQAAISGAESAVEQLGAQTEETRSLAERMSDGFSKAGSFVEDHWLKIAGGAAAAGAATEGFARGQQETNDALTRLSFSTDLTTGELREMAVSFSDAHNDAGDLAAGMEEITKRGFDTEEQLAAITPEVSTFATATGVDMPDAVEKAHKMLSPFGEGLEDVGDNVDQMTRIMTQTDVPIGTLERNLGRVPGELQKLEFGLDDAAAGIDVFRDRGFEGRESVREFRRAVAASEGDMDVFLETIGLTAEEWEDYQKSAEPQVGLAQDMGDALNDNRTIMEQLKQWTGNLATEYGWLADGASVLAPVMLTVASATTAVRGAMKLLGKSGGPIMIIVSALAALGVGLVAAYNKSETFRNIVNTVWDSVKGAFTAAWDAIGPVIETIKGAWGEMVAAFQGGDDGYGFLQKMFGPEVAVIVLDTIDNIGAAIGWVKDTIANAWNAIQPVLATLKDWVSAALPVAFDILKGVVTVVFGAVKMQIQLAWAIIKGIFNTIVWTVETVLAPVFTWLYENIIKPVWKLIAAGIKVYWETIIKPVFKLIVAFVRDVLGPIFKWLYDNIIKPVWDWISQKITAVWNGIIRPAFDAITKAISGGLGPVFEWLWNNIVTPVWNAIGSIITGAWNGVIKPVFTTLKNFMQNTLGPAFKFLYDNVIKPVWDKAGSIIRSVWQNWISPAFNSMKSGLSSVKSAFKTGVSYIGDAWAGLKSLTKTPVNFLIGTVWNGGIVKLWNSVATKFGAKELGTIPKLATGGTVYGPGTSTSDSVPALLSRGEHVWSADEVAAAGGHSSVAELRKSFKAGKAPQFAGGGFINWLQDKGGQAWDATKSGVSAAGGWIKDKAEQASEFIKSPITWLTSAAEKLISDGGASTAFSDLAAKAPVQVIKDGATKIKEMVGFGQSGGGGGSKGISGPLRKGGWVRPSRGRITSGYGARPGLAGVTGSAFHNGIDFAGGGATYAARDGKVLSTGWNITPYNSGIGIMIGHGGGYNTYYGHNPVGGVRVSAGQEVKAGQRVGTEGATGNVTGVHLHFGVQKGGRFVNPSVTGLFDDGGWLNPGDTAVNLSRKPEPVFSSTQWATMRNMTEYAGRALARSTAGGTGPHEGGCGDTITHNTYNITMTVEVEDLEDVRDVQEFIEKLKQEQKLKRAHERGTKRSGKVNA